MKKENLKNKGLKAKESKNPKMEIKDSNEILIEKMLEQTKQRWIKDSSLAVLCCTESRAGGGGQS